MKNLFLLLSVCLFSSSILAQGTLKEAKAQITSQGSYEKVIYYGVDLSHVRVNDASKISRSVEYSKVYPAAWVAYVEEELPPDGIVKRTLGFPSFQYKQQEIYETSVTPNPQFIVGYDNAIPTDTLASMVAAYTLQSESGLGLVLIPEAFSKPIETATTWVIFFNVKSRHILYKTKIYGKCKHMGYTAHWGSGIVEGFKSFINH